MPLNLKDSYCMADDKNASLSFQLKAIEIHECQLIRLPAPDISVTNFNMNVAIESNVDPEQKVILVSTRIKIFAEDQATQLGAFTTMCVFNIGTFEDTVKLQPNNVYEVPDMLNETLNSIALGTTRGAMFAEFKGTILHYAFLPIIDIKSLKKEEIKR